MRLLVCVSSVTPAVENEVDSSSVPMFPSRADDPSGCCPSLSASDKRKKLSQSAPLRGACEHVCAWMSRIPTANSKRVSVCLFREVGSVTSCYFEHLLSESAVERFAAPWHRKRRAARRRPLRTPRCQSQAQTRRSHATWEQSASAMLLTCTCWLL